MGATKVIPFQQYGAIQRVKILRTLADIFNRRNEMATKYIVLGITLVYAVAFLIYYLKSDKSV